ncbi:RNA polymerase sigma factor [Eubacterium sp. 1001713B170207_170306_E7]|uniref:RNA polymerase sigma factor n=1 Tax=Eubacterium sp. 1001713B170207_170306_E7 TaxID=2787097 RepID=UPI00189756B3|nr:RNA polymerase sigma factor [Eubacterium sp. 1001713B170207_170306_E7]
MAQTINNQSLYKLVTAAQQGDREAFSDLFRLSSQQQYHYACLIMNDPFLAEDIVQEVYIKLYQNIRRIKEPEKFLAYVSRMTFNQCLMYKRQRFYQTEGCVGDEALSAFEEGTASHIPEKNALKLERSECLAKGLRSLSEEECYAFVMHYYENKNIRKISEEMALSESTVKRRIRDARKKMANYLTARELHGILAAPAFLLTKSQQEQLLSNILKATGDKSKISPQKSMTRSRKATVAVLSFCAALGLLLAPAIVLNRPKTPEPSAAQISTTPADQSPPSVVSISNTADTFTIMLIDSSEIDYEAVYVTTPSGERLAPLSVDLSSGTMVFPISGDTYTLHLADIHGNAGTAPVAVEQESP